MELALPPEAASVLARRPRASGTFLAARGRGVPLSIVWHDDAAGSLREAGLTVAERREGRVLVWRLERMRPGDVDCAPSGTPEAVLQTAAQAAELRAAPVAVAGFSGLLRVLHPVAEMSAVLMQGELRAATSVRPACRLLLAGPAPAVVELALRLAETVGVQVPEVSLAAEAYGMARLPVAPRRLGAPLLPSAPDPADASPAGLDRGELDAPAACRFVCAHLADVIQHHARLVGPEMPEAVHQIRVATRRLRASLAMFRRAMVCRANGGADAEDLRGGLQEMARILGPAREWDVFLAETGRVVEREFAEEPAIGRMLAAAGRRRDACYADLATYFGGPQFRRLGIALVAFAAFGGPSEESRQPAADAEPGLRAYAAQALDRRLARLVKLPGDVMLLPVEALHAVRLHAKRLRYAAEVFAPLFSPRRTRKFLRRLQRLQDRMGTLNDGAAAAALMAELGAAGRGFAAGAVRGIVAGQSPDGRRDIAVNLRKLKHISPFWR